MANVTDTLQAPLVGVPSSAPPAADAAGTAAAAAAASAAPAAPAPAKTPSRYPGTFEHLHRECKDMFASSHALEGFRFASSMPLTEQFTVTHQFQLGGSKGSEYNFAPTYMGANKGAGEEAYPILMGNVDHSGNVSGTVIHMWNSMVRTKLNLQTHGKSWGYQSEVELRGSDFHMSLKTVNGSLLDKSGVFLANYLQSITPTIALGAELMYQMEGNIEDSGVFLAGRYRGQESISTLSFSPQGIAAATHVQQVGKGKGAFCTELEVDLRKLSSLCTVGYQFMFRTGIVRGQVDTNGMIAATIDQQILQFPLTLCLTGVHDFSQDKSKFGIGLNFGAP